MNKEKKLFISVHGIDGVGKTTLVNALTQELNKLHQETINYDEYERSLLSPYRKIKKDLQESRTVTEQYLFFLASTLLHAAEISRLKTNQHVIKARYLLDVVGHFSFLGVSETEQIASLLSILHPDLIVILLLDEAERQNRIAQRQISNDFDLIPKKQGSRAAYMEQFFLEKAHIIHPTTKLLTLDTTHESAQQLAKKIIAKV